MLDDVVWRSSDLQTYLSGEVMAHLPAELAEFADALSRFRRFNALLACSLAGDSKPNALLRRMDDGNLLPIRVDLDD